MTLTDLVRQARYGVKSAQVQQDLKSFVNRAIRTVAERYNFSAMRDLRTVTIPSGFDHQDLSADFKQLNEEPSPISFVYGNYQLPVYVTTRSRMQSWGIWPFPNGPFSFPVPGGNFPVRACFLERNGPGGNWQIYLPPQFSITSPAVFLIQAYWYPVELVQGSDENPFTRDGNLVPAIIALTQAFAYIAENPVDPAGDVALQRAEEFISRAMYSEAIIRQGGATLRM